MDATNECSLFGSTADDPFEAACALNSTLGLGAHKRLNMRFGETNCPVTLRHCSPGACYISLDYAARIPVDGALTGSSLVKEVRDVRGGSVTLAPEGLTVRAHASRVSFIYDTYTCEEFYRIRGRQYPQLCQAHVEALSRLVAGLAVLGC